MRILTATWAWLRGWAIGLCLLLGALVTAWVIGREKGKQAGEADARDARDDAANAEAKADQLEARHETDAQVAQLPAAPAQRVGDARPDTAAGQLLRDWTRD